MNAEALALVLDGVVEACLAELVAARDEVHRVRTCTTAERQELEARIADLETRLAERTREAERLAGELETVRAALVRASERAAALKVPAPATAPSLHLSAPRVAVEKSAPITPAPPAARPYVKQPPEDLTGKRLGSYVCEGRTGLQRMDGRILWLFRCELCKARKDYADVDVRRIESKGASPCACVKGGPPPKRQAQDRTGLVLGSFVCEGDGGGDGNARRWLFRCRECKGRLVLTAGQVSNYLGRESTPRCRTCEPHARQGRRPRVEAHPAPSHDREDAFVDSGQPEPLDDLESSGDGDVDGLLAMAMREAEGDGFVRSLAARADRPRRREGVTDGEFAEVGEDERHADPDDEDADEDELEELDFEEATG